MVIVLDFEGVVVNSMPTLINLGIECVKKHFNLEIGKGEAEEMVLRFSGGTFGEVFLDIFERLVPEYDKEKYEKCYRELIEKRAAIYEETEFFPEAIEAIKQLSENFHLVICSNLERVYIEKCLIGKGILGLFEAIYSGEDGRKEKRIQMLRHKYPGEKIVFVGDSLYEMKLGDKPIGVARQPWKVKPLEEAGASAIISSLDELFDLL